MHSLGSIEVKSTLGRGLGGRQTSLMSGGFADHPIPRCPDAPETTPARGIAALACGDRDTHVAAPRCQCC